MKKSFMQYIGKVSSLTLGLQGPQSEGNRPLRGCYKLGKASFITLGSCGNSFEFTGRPARRAYLR